MKVSIDKMALRLEAALGANCLTSEAFERAAHSVDGKQPSLVCAPANAEQIVATLRICAESEAAVAPWGAGTAMRLGNVPRQLDLVVETTKLNRVIEHDHANLTATVQSGIVLANLQTTLTPRKQYAPFDPPFPERATVGGIVAANLNGPRRAAQGSVRDLIIGMKVVLGTGTEIKAGGKVVKNVAGYDMCKLFVGSLGTLGIITEITLRVAPVPETVKTVVLSGNLSQVATFADALSRSLLLPAATCLIGPGAARASNFAATDWHFAMQCEGFEETVARHLRDAQGLAKSHSLSCKILQEGAQEDLWRQLRDFPMGRADEIIYRITVPRSAIGNVIEKIQTLGFTSVIFCDTEAGTIWLATSADRTCAAQFPELIALAQQQRGHAIMFAAPTEFKSGLDIWGPTSPTLPLMGKIKRQFDPHGILNAGRFLNGV